MRITRMFFRGTAIRRSRSMLALEAHLHAHRDGATRRERTRQRVGIAFHVHAIGDVLDRRHQLDVVVGLITGIPVPGGVLEPDLRAAGVAVVPTLAAVVEAHAGIQFVLEQPDADKRHAFIHRLGNGAVENEVAA